VCIDCAYRLAYLPSSPPKPQDTCGIAVPAVFRPTHSAWLRSLPHYYSSTSGGHHTVPIRQPSASYLSRIVFLPLSSPLSFSSRLSLACQPSAIQAARRVCASDRSPSRRSFSTFDTPFPRIRRDKIIRQHHPAPAALNPPAAALAPSTADPQNEHPLERACLPAIQPLTTFYFSSSSSLEHWPRPSASTHCHAATNFDSTLETTVDD